MADYLSDLKGKTIIVNGVSYPDRKNLEFKNDNLTVADKPGTDTTELTINGSLTGPTIGEDGYVAIASGGDLTYIDGDTDGYVLTWNASAGEWEAAIAVPGTGAVNSVFSRTGNVVALPGDYEAAQVTNDSGVAGATVRDALNNLDAASGVSSVFGRTGAVIAVASDYDASQVDNDSSVAGATVADALDTLATSTGGDLSSVLANGNITDGYDIIISNGDKITTTTNADNDLTLKSGDNTSGSGDSGDVNITSGFVSSGSGKNGDITLSTFGSGNTGGPGDINLTTGQAAAASDGIGGDVNITLGNGTTGRGGDFVVTAGDSSTGGGGAARLTAGNSISGTGGDVEITAGTGATGGDIKLNAFGSDVVQVSENTVTVNNTIQCLTDNLNLEAPGNSIDFTSTSMFADVSSSVSFDVGSFTVNEYTSGNPVLALDSDTETSVGSGKLLSWNGTKNVYIDDPTTSSNAGVGASLVIPKSGNDLPFKGLIGGLGVTLTPSASDVTISADVEAIAQSGVYGEFYIASGDSAETTIATINTPVKVAGTTTAGDLNDFEMSTDNRLTYVGGADTAIKITCSVTLSKIASGVEVYTLYIYKNGVQISKSASSREMENIDSGSMSMQVLADASPNDYFEIWVENNDGTDNITAVQMSMIVSVSGAAPSGFDYVVESWEQLVNAADGYDVVNELLTLYDQSYLIAADITVPGEWKIQLVNDTTIQGSAQINTSLTFDVDSTDGYGCCILSPETGRWALNNLRLINTSDATLVCCQSDSTSLALFERCNVQGLGIGLEISGDSTVLLSETRFVGGTDQILITSADATAVVARGCAFGAGTNSIHIDSGASIDELTINNASSIVPATSNNVLIDGYVSHFKFIASKVSSSGDCITNNGTITGSSILDNTFIAPTAQDCIIGIEPSCQAPDDATSSSYNMMEDNLWHNTAIDSFVQLKESCVVSATPSYESKITASSYTLAQSDDRKTLNFTSASDQTLNIDPNSSTDIDTSCLFNIVGAGIGDLTIDPGVGVTVNGSNDSFKLRRSMAAGVLWQADTDEWYFSGDAFDEYSQIDTGSTPEGTVSAPVGAEYVSTVTGRAWRKRSGTGATGWQPEQPLVLEADLSGTGLSSGGAITISDGYYNDDAAYTIASNEIEFPQTGRYKVSIRTEMNSSTANNAIGFDLYVGSDLIASPRGFDSAAANDEEVSIPNKYFTVSDTADKMSLDAYVAAGTVDLEESFSFLVIEGPL